MPRGEDTSKHPNRQVGKVIIRQEASELTPEQYAQYREWAEKQNFDERRANLDRGVEFPMKRG